MSQRCKTTSVYINQVNQFKKAIKKKSVDDICQMIEQGAPVKHTFKVNVYSM